ncbi:DUF4403 family protein [Teichococcus vastitatis]|uniref:DUF4403 family protein n=1 Tax=Teichococcus vastitatis TaxID=2307076 RepID=UPI001EE3D9D7|nr:DUF4403 family protein [Pseudoroseomonas vastitatis]
MVRRRWFILLVLPVLVVSGGIGGSLWLHGRDLLLSQAPPRRSATLDLPPQESLAALRFRLPFDTLRRAAEQSLPAEFHQAGEGGGARYELTVRRTGDFNLSEVGGRLRATVPLAVNGKAGLSGGLARALSLGEKNVDAAAEVSADLSLSLDEGWCPIVEVHISYRWTRSPRIELLGGVWLNVEDQVKGPVSQALSGLPAQLREILPCDKVREAALELWQPQSIEVQLPAAPPLHIGIEPQAVGLSDMTVERDAIRVVLALRARTTVSSEPPKKSPPSFLPPLRQLPDRADRGGRLRLSVPVRAGYDMIRDWLMAEFGNKDLPVETRFGTVMLRLRDLFIYPSDPAIAMAVTFSADLPGMLPDTTGRVVISGRPVLDRNGTRIRLEELRFTRDLDSALWSLATLALEPQIRAALSDLAVYDLSGIMRDGLAELRRRLSDPDFTGGMRVTLTDPRLRLQRVVPELDALAVLGTAEAGILAEVTALPFP